jgi:hypothetical protein
MSKVSELPPPGSQFLVYQTENGKLKIDVRFEGETVWLTQLMAERFGYQVNSERRCGSSRRSLSNATRFIGLCLRD